jgi:hypothetical protein
MNGEKVGIWKGMVVTYLNKLFRYSSEEIEKKLRNPTGQRIEADTSRIKSRTLHICNRMHIIK